MISFIIAHTPQAIPLKISNTTEKTKRIAYPNASQSVVTLIIIKRNTVVTVSNNDGSSRSKSFFVLKHNSNCKGKTIKIEETAISVVIAISLIEISDIKSYSFVKLELVSSTSSNGKTDRI